MPRLSLMKPGLAVALLASSLLLTTSLLAAEGEQWVRINHRADTPALNKRGLSERLTDYDSFQWGRLKREQIEQLEQMGLSVVIEHNPFELTLGGESFDPMEREASARVRNADPAGDFHLVQFKGPIRKGWLQSLRARGVEIVQPLHPFSYIVWASSTHMQAARSLPAVRWSGPMRTEWKLPPSQRFIEPGRRPTMALASTHFDLDRLAEELNRFGRVHTITSLGRQYSIVHMEAEGPDYASIADIPGVLTVQHIPQETGPRGEMSNQSIVGAIDGTGAIQPGYQSWLGDTGFNGDGITVGVVDGPILTSHEDLSVHEEDCIGTNGSCDSSGSSEHGTHVAGAISGTGATGATDSNGFLRGQGVAPGAKVIAQIYQPFLDFNYSGAMVPDGMLKIHQDSIRSGALLTNNSWGPTGSPQGYDIPTRQVDMITRDADPDTPGNQPLLPVWAIMNGGGDGSNNCAPSSLGSPDEAKNHFAVGSTLLQDSSGNQRSDIFGVSFNSAHGPACDGRRVPHIVAPGCNTDSTDSDSDTAFNLLCGTSMAAPVVSGSIAVWAEKYVGETGEEPSPALVKAAFTASARDLVGETDADARIMGHRPDRFQGYGRLDLDAVMNRDSATLLYDQKTVFDDSGQNWSLEFQVDNPDKPVRVMLAWTDAPGHGLGGNTPAWVNNLDLSLDADGYTYLGNVIGPDGWAEAGGMADGRNNLEGVYLGPDQLGPAMAVKVVASELAGDALNPYDPGTAKQDFALVCHNCETYTITAEPAGLEACIPQPGDETNQYEVTANLASTGDYNSDVGLSTTDTLAGVVQTMVPEQVTLPGTSTWTLTVEESAIPGESTLFVEGDDGKLRNSGRLLLDLDEHLDTAPSQPSPPDGSELDDLRPAFSWSALPDAGDYHIQIADDNSFHNIVFEQSVNDPSFTPASDLEKWSRYYWRVRGINNCGEGEWSETFSVGTGIFADSFEATD